MQFLGYWYSNFCVMNSNPVKKSFIIAAIILING